MKLNSTVKRLLEIGYSEKEAENLYSLYSQNEKLEDLEKYLQEKEFIRGVL